MSMLSDLPQFQTLFREIWTCELKELPLLYVSSSPLVWGLYLSLILAAVVFVVSEVNKNYSQVDRAWGLLPTTYIAHYSLWAHMSQLNTTKIDMILILTILWGVRLSHTYGRKGGYAKGFEDYRWKIVKSKIPNPVVFTIFNFFFVSVWQNIVLFLVTTPAVFLLIKSQELSSDISGVDIVFYSIMTTLLILEGVADQQQWEYQTAKHSFNRTASVLKSCRFAIDELERGFRTSGLWAYSRHPNVAAEQGIWIALYLWSCYYAPANWGLVGLIVYLLPFFDSSRMTEGVSAQKYPEYAEYQRQVGRFLPKIPLKAYRPAGAAKAKTG